jgi:hypothetical protein
LSIQANLTKYKNKRKFAIIFLVQAEMNASVTLFISLLAIRIGVPYIGFNLHKIQAVKAILGD